MERPMAKANGSLSHFHKRHYEAIALAMQDVNPIRFTSTDDPERRIQYAATLRVLCDLFAGDNGQFKRDRFIRACEPGANVRARSNGGSHQWPSSNSSA